MTDGLKLTPFRLQNVPPPMSTLVLPGTRPLPALPPAHVAFAATSTASVLLFAVVYPDSFLEVYSWTLPLKGNAQKNALAGIPTPELQLSLQLDPNAESPRAVARQCAIRAGEAGEARVAVLRTSSEGDEVLVLDGVAESRRVRRVAVFERVGKLVTATSAARVDPEDSPSDEAQFLLETLNGEILEGERPPLHHSYLTGI